MPPAARLRPTRIEHVVDGVRLRAQLSAAALAAVGDEAEQRRRAIELLKGALFRGRMIAKERLESGGGGVETARLLAKVADEVISALYDFTTVHVFRARNPTEGERLALMAVGGYGRGALAPFSDVDLLFLRPYKQTAHAESVIEYMLYALWDLGFKVGHASRTVDECIKLAREDFTIRTALLEARLLTGDAELADTLKKRFLKEVQAGTAAQFVAAKLKERDDRHTKAGSTRYLVEPNVKEGKGGLRDLNTLFWIAQYLHPSETPTEMVRLEEFTGRELKAFLRAFDFLWAVRAHLHFATGRAEERLSFDLQPEIARRMGYGDSPHGETPAVERFMRRYFLIAKEVGTLTRTFCAQLEEREAKSRPQGISRFLPRMGAGRRQRLGEGFQLDNGRLTVDGPETFERDPVNLLRLFRVADRGDYDLHPDAFSEVTRALNLITPRLRRDPDAGEAFLDVLARGRNPYRTLSLMNEAGVLGRFIPEFGRIVAQMQFNMYHSYTVDEHTLRAVGVIAEVAAGKLIADHPLATQVFPLIQDPEALFLAMLLHDTGKGGEGGQEKAGARSARSACERLGLQPTRIDLIGWLVEHHLLMSDVAQKRDISDPRTIAAFARVVENPERLRLLLVLTVADIRAVGPGVWNGWKGQLLRDLYGSTEALFRGGRGSDPAIPLRQDQKAAADHARERLCSEGFSSDPWIEEWARQMEDAYFNAFSAEEHAAHYQLARQSSGPRTASASARILNGQNTTEVAVAARDRKGLFADLAGCLSAAGANVVGARVYTSTAGQALDLFQIQDISGAPFGATNTAALQRLTENLESAARGEAPKGELRRPLDASRTAAFAVPAAVSIDNEAAEAATVVEVSGRDRPGLLEALARVMADRDLQLVSAHVDGYGERAVDAFYVSKDHQKLTNPKSVAELRSALIKVLEDGESEAPRRRLERARASVAR
jgi:[protein-PII] uridylyltransferase